MKARVVELSSGMFRTECFDWTWPFWTKIFADRDTLDRAKEDCDWINAEHVKKTARRVRVVYP